MPTPRKHQISLDATLCYHCTSRCVRRAFRCGLEPFSGKDYEHRRQWVEDRILFLAEAHGLSDLEVCERWQSFYKDTLFSEKYLRGDSLDDAEWQAVKAKPAKRL